MEKDHTLLNIIEGLAAAEPRLSESEKARMWAAITDEASRHSRRRIVMWAAAAVAIVALALVPLLLMHRSDGISQEQMLAQVCSRVVTSTTVYLGSGSIEVPQKSTVSLDAKNHKVMVVHDGSEMAVDVQDTDGLVAFAVPARSRMEVILADGSHITLREMSKMVVPFDISADDLRQVSLQGEAYMAIHHEEKHPFVATAGDLRVSVLGTKFLMSAYKKGMKETVTLIEGSVAVEVGHGGSTMLSPGQTFVYDKLTARNTIRQEDDAPALTLWKDDLISLDGASLTSVLRKIADTYDVDIHYDRHLTDSIHLGGRLDTSVGIGEVLKRLESIAPIKVVHSGKRYEVMAKHTTH